MKVPNKQMGGCALSSQSILLSNKCIVFSICLLLFGYYTCTFRWCSISEVLVNRLNSGRLLGDKDFFIFFKFIVCTYFHFQICNISWYYQQKVYYKKAEIWREERIKWGGDNFKLGVRRGTERINIKQNSRQTKIYET